MKLLIQPDDGTDSIVRALRAARQSVEVLIFRFDREEIEHALEAAADRGVRVHALIAFTNRGGEKKLRRLESRLLAKGIQVSRTADDLARYHGKMLIVDGRTLFVLGFNFTHLDLKSRSFGLITSRPNLVKEASRLFNCDVQRQPFEASGCGLVVSPVNARDEIGELLHSARRELLIYDVELSDPAMLHEVQRRRKAGVDVRIIGWMPAVAGVERRQLGFRLHVRAIVCDRRKIFLGSQSLRALELDSRREVGVILREPRLAERIARVFEKDWEQAKVGASAPVEKKGAEMPAAKALKRMAKAIVRELPPTPEIAAAVKDVIQEQAKGNVQFEPGEIKDAVRGAVKDAVREAVKVAVSGVMVEELAEEKVV